MSTVAIIAACLSFAFLCAYLLVNPHLYSRTVVPEAEGSTLNLLDQKERCLQVLKDLELDFSTGKLEASEYKRMKGSVSSELAGILAVIDQQTGGGDAER